MKIGSPVVPCVRCSRPFILRELSNPAAHRHCHTCRVIWQLLFQLEKHHEKVAAFYDDPMTEAYGCPTEDFQQDFDKQERAILGKLEDAARAANDKEALDIALGGFEKWMP